MPSPRLIPPKDKCSGGMIQNNSFWSLFPICIYLLYVVDLTQVSAIFYLQLHITPEAFFKDQFRRSSIFYHMDVIFCLIAAPLLIWVFILAPPISLFGIRASVRRVSLGFVILFCWRAERVIREPKASGFLFSCLFAFRGKVSMIGSAVKIRSVLNISIAGVPVGRRKKRLLAVFSDCTCGLAKLQAGFRFGWSLRSLSQLLNPLQTTGQKWLCSGTLNHLFLSYFLPTLYPEIIEENLLLVNGFSGFSKLRELRRRRGEEKENIAGVEISLCLVTFSPLD